MNKLVRFDREAEDELDAALAWYESQRQGLGLELLNAVDDALGKIGESPLQFPLRTSVPARFGVRTCPVQRFPTRYCSSTCRRSSASSRSLTPAGVQTIGARDSDQVGVRFTLGGYDQHVENTSITEWPPCKPHRYPAEEKMVGAAL